MTDFFISKLPSGHAVKDITKAAATASLRGDDIVKATPANTVPLLRQQCAAVVGRPLDDAGVPYDAGDSVSILRGKCGVTAWAAEQLRAPVDVRALPAPFPSRVMDALGVPSAWKSEPQDRAHEGILQGCRGCSWARDPASAHGLVCPQRSAIFRAVESVALASSSSSHARPDQHLSADETARVSALLGT